ncbi:MAG: leucine-rich repeat protein [Clostridia bacterium]|nr:leucine-rich repeat protein [Clostridia bacterium]
MKKKVQQFAARGLSVALAGVLVSACAVTWADKPFAEGASSPASLTSKLRDVTGEVSTDALRSQYLNSDLLEKNPYSDNDERWVIVGFEGDSVMDAFSQNGVAGEFTDYATTTAAKNRTALLSREHQNFLNSLDAKGVSYEYKYSYTTLTNGVAIKVKRKDIATIEGMSGVEKVSISERYAYPKTAVTNNANVYSTGIYDSASTGYDGTGMVVAVLDSGLDKTHPAFSTMPTTLGMDQSDVEEKLAGLEASKRVPGLSIDQVYYNDKIPYAFDYADDDPDVYPSHSSHGTHVSGIIVGKDDNKQVSLENPTETFVGVAPNAQLVFCDTFTDDHDSEMLGGADTIDILAALTDCVALGVDVINMSLGSSAGFSEEGDKAAGEYIIEEVYDAVRAAGISLVCAASNDYSAGFGGGNGTNLASNPDSGTVGSPSTYSAALSVASINGQKSRYMVANGTEGTANEDVAFITNASDINGNEIDFMEQLYEATETPKDQSLTLNYVVVGGVGRPGNYTANINRAFDDGRTIALVKRGDITFAEKVQNAMAAGAIGCIIYNNLSGTIRMSLGEVEDPIPTCSITMDAGKMLVDGATGRPQKGTITFSNDYKAGPFMSEFSSWGPTPDLKLKPEITAHGGEIISSIPGGAYEEQSGTSMASPNMAGAVTLLRQHVQTTVDFGALTGIAKSVALTAYVNQLLMSTTAIALNEEGNPYTPRKQGAGLADIQSAIDAEGYLTVEDENGKSLDKTKLELGDDKEKTGIYTMNFTLRNISGKQETYQINPYVMTETLATDLKTVAEKAHMLDDSTYTYEAEGNGSVTDTGAVTVSANGVLKLTVTVTLSDDAKEYIDECFVNGMYVEGFIRLEKTGSTTVSLGVPFLAFYGDWTKAPLFDYDVYELAEFDKDTSIEEEDKPKASAATTRPLGLYWDDTYILPLGTYLYELPEDETDIYPEIAKSAISAFDMEGRRTIYEMYAVYGGLLRAAKTMQVDVVDAQTGETVYTKLEHNVRKSFAGGGGNYGSPIMFEMDPVVWGMSNNTTYNVTMSGTLDYEGGENPDRNSFAFSFTVDTESPVVRDYRIVFEPYTENKETKYRIYLDIDVYDNQYVMDVMPCYLRYNTAQQANQLTLLTEYPIPVYSQKGEETTVRIEITDYYQDIKDGNIYLSVEDYALNQSVYVLDAVSHTEYPEKVLFETDDKLTLKTEGTINTYELTLQPNECYKVTMSALPEETVAASLAWSSTREAVVKAHENEIYAFRAGTATINMLDGDGNVAAVIRVTVDGTQLSTPLAEKITFEHMLNGDGHLVDPNTAEVELHPNQENVRLVPKIEPWYTSVDYEWSSSNDTIATVDQAGNVTPHRKGTVHITVRAKGYDRLTKTVRFKVGDDYYVNSYTLYNYYGGEEAIVPDDLNVMYLDEECFRYNTTIKRVVLPSTLMEIPERAFEGCTSLEEIVIPADCTQIFPYAFNKCSSLKKIVLLEAEDEITGGTSTGTVTIGRSAFAGCAKLDTIENQHRITTVYDRAFEGCTGLTQIDLSGLRIAGDYVFSGCSNLATVITTKDTFLGDYMFNRCTKLIGFTFKGERLGDGVFQNCSNLEWITFEANVFYGIGENAFSGCRSLEEIYLPNGTYAIGANAFKNCAALTSVNFSANTCLVKTAQTPFAGAAVTAYTVAYGSPYYQASEGVLYNASFDTVELVPATKTTVSLPDTVTKIGANAFAGSATEMINLSNITELGEYAFANSAIRSVDLSTVSVIPVGAFYGCSSLATVIGIENVTSIGDYAFADCNEAWKNSAVAFGDGLTEIGDYAFQSSSMTHFTANGLQSVGDYAFKNGNLSGELSFPAMERVGSYAFSENPKIESVAFGPVTEMGEGVFYCTCDITNSQPALTEVSFADGATDIGTNTFALVTKSSNGIVITERENLTTVTLPDTVTKIGAYVFTLATGLQDVNLTNVTEVGEYAFYGCESLELSGETNEIEAIGVSAFAMTTSLTSMDLPSASFIGMGAFMASGLQTVEMPVVRQVGEGAFAGTSLQTITIPNTAELTFDESWYEIAANGKPELKTGKKTNNLYGGAFADIPTLEEILVTGEGKLRSVDGVLYSERADGLVLEQYPAARAGSEYSVLSGTVRIADYAFLNTVNLESVFLPYTVRSIGSYAFYNDEYVEDTKVITDFTFEGVEAPVLEASYSETDGIYIDGNEDAWSYGLFYSNFRGFVKDSVYIPTLTVSGVDQELTITRPENGIGYHSPIWTAYFSTVEESEYAPELNTRLTIDALAELPTVDDVLAILENGTAEEQKAAITALSEDVVQPVRTLYNKITAPKQLELVTEKDKLFDVEEAVREVKAELGIPAVMEELVIVSRPDKIKYVDGERFDATGMVIKAIYDDKSEITVTDYSVDKDVLEANDSGAVTVTISYNGLTCSINLNVSYPEQEVPPTDGPGGGQGPADGGLPIGAIIGIAVGGVVLLAGAGVGVFFFLRSKKANAVQATAEEESEETSSEEEKSEE